MTYLSEMSNVIPFQRYKDATDMTIMQVSIWLHEHGWTNPKVRFLREPSGFRVQIERLPVKR